MIGTVLAETGERLPASTGAAKRQLVWSWIEIAVRGTRYRDRGAPNTRISADELRLDMMRSASLGLSMVDLVPSAAFQARSVLLALKIGDRRRIAYALAFHAMFVGSSGKRIPHARALIAQAREIAQDCKSEFLLGWARAGEGIVEFFAGHYGESLVILDEAEVQLRDRSVGSAAELNQLRNFMLFALRRLGAYGKLHDRLTEYVRDAMRRGDRYAATSYVWSSNVVWLAANDAPRARADLASVTWSRPEDGLHLQHWFHVRAQCEIALYEDEVAELDRLEPLLRPFLGPAFAHVEAVATETRYLLARFAIRRGDAKTARREVSSLHRYRAPYVRAFVRMVIAAAEAVAGRDAAAREVLAGAIADAESSQMTTLAAIARRRFAELSGDPAAVVEADASLVARGLVDPARFARVFATWPSR